MKRYIYLLRHGNPGYPGDDRRCLGIQDVPVSDYGKAQIRKSREYIEGFKWTKVYSSPLRRCIETAECLGIEKEELEIRENLREMAAGIWENLTFKEIREKYPELYEERGKSLGTFAVEGAESFGEAGERFGACLDEIREETDENILVIAHAGVIRGYLCLLDGKCYDEVMDYSIPFGSVTVLEEYEGTVQIVEGGLRSCKLLDAEEIRRLYQKCHTPENVIAHMEKVAETVQDIFTKIDNRKLFCENEKELVYKAALVHDICRTEKNHAQKSADFLRKEGYKDVADLVLFHHSEVIEEEESLKLHELLFYADKLVVNDQIVTMEERFAKSFEKCKGIPEAESKHRKLYYKTKNIEEKIKNILTKK